MPPTPTRRPIIDPILLALKSRRVIVALCTLLIGLLTLAVPDLQPIRGELLTLLITLGLAVIAGYSVEDAARLARDRSTIAPDAADLRELLREVLTELLTEAARPDSLPEQPRNP